LTNDQQRATNNEVDIFREDFTSHLATATTFPEDRMTGYPAPVLDTLELFPIKCSSLVTNSASLWQKVIEEQLYSIDIGHKESHWKKSGSTGS